MVPLMILPTPSFSSLLLRVPLKRVFGLLSSTGSLSSLGDSKSFSDSVSACNSFAGGNAHLITSAEYAAFSYLHYALLYGTPQRANQNFADLFNINYEWNADCPSSYENSLGHAIYETSSDSSGNNSWFGSESTLPTSNKPYLTRYPYSNIFLFSNASSTSSYYYRPVRN